MTVAASGALWMLGCGNMGGAMLRRWFAAGMAPDRVTVVTRSGRNVPGGVRSLDALPVSGPPETLVLAVKPQQLDTVADEVAHVAPRRLVSILAGVEVAALRRRIAAPVVVRAMPNLPVAIGQGVTAVHVDGGDAGDHDALTALFAPLGHVEPIADERLFDAVTALAGCGPGFVFRFADALAQAGETLGLDEAQARRLALATLAGSARMAADAAEVPATLADRVASPGGSTRRGLDVLDADDGIVDLMTRTLAASARRNAELAAAAR